MLFVLIIRLLQQHVVATRCLADATLRVARATRAYYWVGDTGSVDDEEPG
jgi:hypothetical protein